MNSVTYTIETTRRLLADEGFIPLLGRFSYSGFSLSVIPTCAGMMN